MLLSQETSGYQRMLAEFCRRGDGELIPGMREGRAEVYRDLVFSVVEDTLARAYPITKARLGSELWAQLTQDFFSHYACSSPHLWQMPRELISFAKDSHYRRRSRLPYLDDLLRFEWVEIEVFNMEDAIYPAVRSDGDFLKDILIVNQECRILELSYPVFRPATEKELATAAQFRLLVYRHPERLTVEFIELSPFFAELLRRLSEAPQAVEKILSELTKCECVRPTPEMIAKVSAFVENLNHAGMIRGFLEEQGAYEKID